MAKYKVKQGDCTSSIACDKGFLWKTLWDHPENAQLKNDRKDPNVLYPGDTVHISEIEEKEENCSDKQKHRFRLKGRPVKTKMQLLLNDKARSDESYELYVDDELRKKGKTDAKGFVEASIPPKATKGEIVIRKKANEERYEFYFGTLDPLSTDEGIKGRLLNLGYPVKDDLSSAIKAYQSSYKTEGLTETGTADQDTRNHLKGKFGE